MALSAMRVLHIDTGREMRGGQYQVGMLVEGLERNQVSSTVLANTDLGVSIVGSATWRSVRQHSRRADIIHAHDSRAHTLAVVHGAGKPVVVSRRVAFPLKRGLLSRWKYGRAAHFVAVSEHVADQLTKAGIAPEKISVVFDAVKTVNEARPEDRGSAGFRVLTHGLTDPLKGRELVAAACRKAGVEPTFAADLPRDLLAADVFIYLSESEGLGSAILLAMTSGVAVIASRVGGIPEIITNDQTGLLVENDVASVAEAIRRLQSDAELRRAIAAAGKRRAIEEFGDTRMVLKTRAIYRRVLGFPPQPCSS
jgi:glycosyltransferase involved in cell wall biosynthesis